MSSIPKLKQYVHQLFQKQYKKDQKKVDIAYQVVEDFFKTNPKMDEALLNKLKKKVTNEVFSQLSQQKLILPPINPKSTLITPTHKINTESDLNNSIATLPQKLDKSDNNDDVSVYEANQGNGNEYALIIKKKYQQFIQEEENKKQKKIQKQIQLKQELDALVEQKKLFQQQKRQKENNESLNIVQNQINTFDQEQKQKEQLQLDKLNSMKVNRQKQMEEQSLYNKTKRQQSEQMSKLILGIDQNGLEQLETEKRMKKLKERQFYESVDVYGQTKLNKETQPIYDFSKVFDENAIKRNQKSLIVSQNMDKIQDPIKKYFQVQDPFEQEKQINKEIIQHQQNKIQLQIQEEQDKKQKQRIQAQQLCASYNQQIELKKLQERGQRIQELDRVQKWKNEQSKIDMEALKKMEESRHKSQLLVEYNAQQMQLEKINANMSPKPLNNFQKMTQEELLINKHELKGIYLNNDHDNSLKKLKINQFLF